MKEAIGLLRCTAIASGFVYLALCALLYIGQHKLLYQTSAAPVLAEAPEIRLPGFQTVELATRDGEKLLAWYIPPRDGTTVVMYLHGNAGTLASRADRFRWFADRGLGVLAVSWRGYGGSSGSPSEAGLLEDASTAWRWLTVPDKELTKRIPVAPLDITLYGESLGTAVAVILAAQVQPGSLILDSPFTSARDVAKRHYPWMPIRLLMKDSLVATDAATQVKSRVLHIQCSEDPVTNTELGLALAPRFPSKPELLMIHERCHVPSFRKFERRLEQFLQVPS